MSDKTQSLSMQMHEVEKKKFGVLLPKSGVYFLPDQKILAFLKILNWMRVQAEKDGNYGRAKHMQN